MINSLALKVGKFKRATKAHIALKTSIFAISIGLSFSKVAYADQLPNVVYSYKSGQTFVSGTAVDPDHSGTVRIGAWIDGKSIQTIYASGGNFTFNIPNVYWDGKSHNLVLNAVNIEPDGTAPGQPYKQIGPISFVVHPKPTARIYWSPSTVNYGDSSTLNWSSTNATDCSFNGASRGPSGAWLGTNRTFSQTVSMTCSGPGGTSNIVSANLVVNQPNQAPTVSLSLPTAFNEGVAVTAQASASDPDGSVTEVLFSLYRADNVSNLLAEGSDNSAPYSHSFGTLAAGDYMIRARARDNKGAMDSQSGAERSFKVVAVPKPLEFYNLSYSPNPASIGQSQTFSFDYRNAVKCWMDPAKNPRWSSPVVYVNSANGQGVSGTYSWSSQPRQQTDNWTQTVTCVGEDGTSIDRSVLNTINGPVNNPPAVDAINLPAEYASNSPVTVSAKVSDTDGTIASVVFAFINKRDGKIIDTIIGEPKDTGWYEAITTLQAGSYMVKVIATDNAGLKSEETKGIKEFSVIASTSPKITELSYFPNPVPVGGTQTFKLRYENVYACWMDPALNPRWNSRVDYVTDTGVLKSGTFEVVTSARTSADQWVQTVRCRGEDDMVIDANTQNTILAVGDEIPKVSISKLAYAPAVINVGESQVFSFTYENARKCWMDASKNPAWETDVVYVKDDGTIKSGTFSVDTAVRNSVSEWTQTVSCTSATGEVVDASVTNVVVDGIHISNFQYLPSNPVKTGEFQYFAFDYSGVAECYSDVTDNQHLQERMVYVSGMNDESGRYESEAIDTSEAGQWQHNLTCVDNAGNKVTATSLNIIEDSDTRTMLLSWAPVVGAKSYKIELSKDSGETWFEFTNIAATSFPITLGVGDYILILKGCINGANDNVLCEGVSDGYKISFSISDPNQIEITQELVGEILSSSFDSLLSHNDAFKATFNPSTEVTVLISLVEFSLDGIEWSSATYNDNGFVFDFGQLSIGEHHLHVRVTDNSGNTYVVETIVTVNEQINGATPEFPDMPVLAGLPSVDELSTEIGTIVGDFRVNELGGATYEIPFELPSGIAGQKPNLGISYNSNGGNGHIGVGWNIAGTSEIQRCRLTLATDGFTDAIHFKQSDPLCLNGARLVTVNGSLQGSDGAEYRTAIDSQIRVIARGVSTSATSSYDVQYPDGSTHTYDYRAIDDNSGVPYRWMLSSVVDNMGNSIKFSYNLSSSIKTGTLGANEIVLSRVRYGDTSVDYYYNADRGDTSTNYINGNPLKINAILDEVEITTHGNQRFGSFKFNYESTPSSTGLKKLISITKCGTEANHCLPSTQFNWSDADNKLLTSVVQEHDLKRESVGNHFGALSDFKFGDINGDGLSEIIYMYQLPPNSYGEPSKDFRLAVLINTGRNFVKTNEIHLTGWEKNGKVSKPKITVIDHDHDGNTDLLFAGSNGYLYSAFIYGDSELRTNTVSGPNAQPNFVYLDMNGDGYTDRYMVSVDSINDTLAVSYGGPDGFGAFQPVAIEMPEPIQELWPCEEYDEFVNGIGAKPLDFNGDGLSDLIAETKQIYSFSCEQDPNERPEIPEIYEFLSLYLQTKDESGKTYYKFSKFIENSSDFGFTRALDGDINGDGLSDLVYLDQALNYQCYVATGLEFNSIDCLKSEVSSTNVKHASLVDVNGDGRSDFVYNENNVWLVRYSDGLSFSQSAKVLLGDGSSSTIQIDETASRNEERVMFIDLDGRGFLNFIKINLKQNLITIARNPYSNSIQRDLVTGIVDGFGRKTEIMYKPLTDSSVYRKSKLNSEFADDDSLAVYELINSTYVVSKVSTTAPYFENETFNSDGMLSVNYEYEGLRAQAGGRGYLGFEKIRTYDPQRNVTTQTTYHQAFPLTGLPKDTVRYLGVGADILSSSVQYLDRAENSYEVAFLNDGASLYPYLSEAKNYYYAPSGINESVTTKLVSIKKTTNVYTGVDKSGYEHAHGVIENTDNHINLSKVLIETFDANNQKIGLTETVNKYEFENIDNWWLSRVTNSKIRKWKKSSPHTFGATDINRETAFEYYPSGSAYQGMLLREITLPGAGGHQELTTLHCYDEYGNRTDLVTHSDHFNISCGAISDQKTEDDPLKVFRWQKTSYHHGGNVASVGNAKFPATLTISESDYNVFGLETKTSGIDGVVSYTAYDSFGVKFAEADNTGRRIRKIRRVASQGSQIGAPVIDQISDAVYVIEKTIDDGAPTQFRYLDIMMREIGWAAQGFDGRYILKYAFYDQYGRQIVESLPFYNGDQNYISKVAFDSFDRVLNKVTADGSVSKFTYSDDGSTVTVSFTPKVGNTVTKKTVTNLLGETILEIDDITTTHYSYDASGNMTRVLPEVDGGLVINEQIKTTFDLKGQKIAINDPNKGVINFVYNALGELVTQKDNIGNTNSYYRDSLGRTTSRETMSGSTMVDITLYNYNGHLLEKECISTSDISSCENVSVGKFYDYDDFSRIILVRDLFEGKSYDQKTYYDKFGRIFKKEDAAGNYYGVKNNFNEYGYLESQEEARYSGRDADRQIYFQVLEMDALGNVIRFKQGNGVETYQKFELNSGFLKSIEAFSWGVVQNSEYEFDSFGNLTKRIRHDLNDEYDGRLEEFKYDKINRLTHINSNGAGYVESVKYGANGNINWKIDAGFYCYNSYKKPHAVRGIGPESCTDSEFIYDDNGNMTVGNGKGVVYSAFNKAISITTGSDVTHFAYNSQRSRYKRMTEESGITKTTYYVGGVEFVFDDFYLIETRRYLPNAIQQVKGNGVVDTYYLHKDHIGSIDTVTNSEGLVVNKLYFDAWGNEKSIPASYWDFSESLLATSVKNFNDISLIGFTGHEHIDHANLIHMNGRVYDPEISRFLQADPFIQEIRNSQSYNRYSYVWNNPLSYTDPTGYFTKGFSRFIDRHHATIAAIYLTAIGGYHAGQALLAGNVAQAYGIAFATGFASGGVATGTLSGAFSGGMASVAFLGVGQAVKSAGDIAKVLSHATVGGIISDLQGGKFGHGFISAGITKGAQVSGFISDDFLKGAFQSGLVGGTVSELTGGKFANGAVTAAFQSVMNHSITASQRKHLFRAIDENIANALEGELEKSVEFELKVKDPRYIKYNKNSEHWEVKYKGEVPGSPYTIEVECKGDDCIGKLEYKVGVGKYAELSTSLNTDLELEGQAHLIIPQLKFTGFDDVGAEANIKVLIKPMVRNTEKTIQAAERQSERTILDHFNLKNWRF